MTNGYEGSPEQAAVAFLVKTFVWPARDAIRDRKRRTVADAMAFHDAHELARQIAHKRLPVEISEASR